MLQKLSVIQYKLFRGKYVCRFHNCILYNQSFCFLNLGILEYPIKLVAGLGGAMDNASGQVALLLATPKVVSSSPGKVDSA